MDDGIGQCEALVAERLLGAGGTTWLRSGFWVLLACAAATYNTLV